MLSFVGSLRAIAMNCIASQMERVNKLNLVIQYLRTKSACFRAVCISMQRFSIQTLKPYQGELFDLDTV